MRVAILGILALFVCNCAGPSQHYQDTQVRADGGSVAAPVSEYDANLEYCLRGHRTGCRHNELQPGHRAAVRNAEYEVNLQYCSVETEPVVAKRTCAPRILLPSKGPLPPLAQRQAQQSRLPLRVVRTAPKTDRAMATSARRLAIRRLLTSMGSIARMAPTCAATTAAFRAVETSADCTSPS
jgi:hypothetical protein